MLAQTVRNNLKSIQNLEMKTKTRKFSSLFQSDPTITIEEVPIEEILAQTNLAEYIKKEDEMEIVDAVETSDDEISEYIVENPNEVVVQFPLVPNIELNEKLPFFKSLSLKLANL